MLGTLNEYPVSKVWWEQVSQGENRQMFATDVKSKEIRTPTSQLEKSNYCIEKLQFKYTIFIDLDNSKHMTNYEIIILAKGNGSVNISFNGRDRKSVV